MSLSKDEAARALGMKVAEVTDVKSVKDGHVVETFDGAKYHVDKDGHVSFAEPGPKAPASAPMGVHQPAAQPASRRGTPVKPRADGQGIEVPVDGDPADVLEWVGDDLDRARAALEAEEARPTSRADLTAPLYELLGSQKPIKVPDGNEKTLLKWVGDDKARAHAALDAEQAKDTPRSGVTEALRRIVDDDRVQ
jgi:hypothetical protein